MLGPSSSQIESFTNPEVVNNAQAILSAEKQPEQKSEKRRPGHPRGSGPKQQALQTALTDIRNPIGMDEAGKTAKRDPGRP